MNLSDVIAMGLGLAFTYALLSVIASTLKESIAGVLAWRAKNLRASLAGMLAGIESGGPVASSLFERVYGHSLVAGMSAKATPSYVPARNFTLALLDVLGSGSQSTPISAVERSIAALPDCAVRQTLQVFVTEAAGDIDTFKQQIDSWFDDTMDRLSGVYKRRTQFLLFLLGLAMAVALNVDTIRIVSSLQDSAVRKALADQATAFANDSAKVGGKADAGNAANALAALPVPIGWRFCSDAQGQAEHQGCDAALAVPFIDAVIADRRDDWQALVIVLIGWLLTAVAVSFGAPFWFDLLNQLVNLRAAGPRPPRADAGAT